MKKFAAFILLLMTVGAIGAVYQTFTVNGFLVVPSTDAITAFATGGQANATQLTAMVNRVSVCATAGDSVKLPLAFPGANLIVANDGAQSCDVFPATGDLINGGAANTQIALKAGGFLEFSSTVTGRWNAQLPGPLKFVSLAPSAPVAVQAETIFATNQYTIRANTLKVGTKIHIRGEGTIATANGTCEIRVRYGGVAGVLLLDTGNSITPASGDLFQFDGSFVVTDTGATGHTYGTFLWTIGTSATATARMGKTTSVAIDTTADKVLCVTQQLGLGAGSLTLDYLDVEIH